MAGNMRQLFHMYALYAKMDAKWFMNDAKFFLIVVFSEWIGVLSALSGIFLLAQRFGGVGGMSADEVLFMLGFFCLSSGLMSMMFGGFNVHQISRRIGRGQVDHMLMQPVPLWMQLMTEGFLPVSGNSGFLTGIAVTAIATARLGIAASSLWVANLALLAIAHVAIEMGLSFFIGSSAFYRPVACEEISSVGHDLLTTLGRYPLSGIPLIVQQMLVTVVPAGLMAWLPAMILLNKTVPGTMAALPFAVAVGFLTLGQHFFRKGLKYYVKNGSNRYREMGHRN